MSRPEFTEEELAAIEAEMARLKVDDVLLQTLVTLINLGARKAGLATEPGTEPPERDLEQTRQAIDGARALLPVLEPRHGQELGPIKEALSRLQMAYVQLSGGTPSQGEEAKPEQPGPPKPPASGRLWVPGQ
jgi:hypothetical protein